MKIEFGDDMNSDNYGYVFHDEENYKMCKINNYIQVEWFKI